MEPITTTGGHPRKITSALFVLLSCWHGVGAAERMSPLSDPAALLERYGMEPRLEELGEAMPPKMDASRQLSEVMRATGIAEPGQAEEYARALSSLGVPGPGHARLYIAVSQSMPTGQLRAYAMEAARTGAVLVVRGIDPDQTLSEFIHHWAAELVDIEGAGSVQIDPRVFDAFAVEAVPTIILTTAPSMDLCADRVERREEVDGTAHDYAACLPQEDGFYKITGAVTMDYALDAFAEAGSEHAEAFRAALGDDTLVDPDDPDGRAMGEVSDERWAKRSSVRGRR